MINAQTKNADAPQDDLLNIIWRVFGGAVAVGLILLAGNMDRFWPM